MSACVERPLSRSAQPRASPTHHTPAATSAGTSRPQLRREKSTSWTALTAIQTTIPMATTKETVRMTGSARAIRARRDGRPAAGAVAGPARRSRGGGSGRTPGSTAAVSVVSMLSSPGARRGRPGDDARGAALAPPGGEDHARVAEPVEDVVALLALAGRPLVHDDGDLGDPVALEDGADEQLRGLVLDLLLPDRGGHLRAHHAVAARGVRDLRAGQQPHEGGEHVHAGLAEGVLGLRAAEHARADHEVGLVARDRREHLRELHRVPLAVGVEGDD